MRVFVFLFLVLLGAQSALAQGFAYAPARDVQTYWVGWRNTGNGFTLSGWTCSATLQQDLATDAARLTVWALPAIANPRDFTAWTPLNPRPVFGEFEGADQIACPGFTRARSVELTFTKPDLFVGAGNKARPRYQTLHVTLRHGYYWSSLTYGRVHRAATDTQGIAITPPDSPLSLSYWAQNDTWINQLFRPDLGRLDKREAPRSSGNLGLSPRRVIELFRKAHDYAFTQGFNGVSQTVLFADFALWNVGEGAVGSDLTQANLTGQTGDALDTYWWLRLQEAYPCFTPAPDDLALPDCDYLFQLRARSKLGGILPLYLRDAARLTGPRILSVRLNDKHQTDRFLNVDASTDVAVLGRAMTAGSNKLACFAQGREGPGVSGGYCAGDLDLPEIGQKAIKVNAAKDHVVLDFSSRSVRAYKRWLVKDLARHAALVFARPEAGLRDTVFELDLNRTFDYGEIDTLWPFLRLLAGEKGVPCGANTCDIRNQMPDAFITVRLPSQEAARNSAMLDPERLSYLQIDGLILSNEKQVASNELLPLNCGSRDAPTCVFPTGWTAGKRPGLIFLELFHKTARSQRSAGFRPLTPAETATYWHVATGLLGYDGVSLFNHYYYVKDFPPVWQAFTQGDRFARHVADPLRHMFAVQHYLSDKVWRAEGNRKPDPIGLYLKPPLTGWSREQPGQVRVNLAPCAMDGKVTRVLINGVDLGEARQTGDPQAALMPADWARDTSGTLSFALPPVPFGRAHYLREGFNQIELKTTGGVCVPLVELIAQPAQGWRPIGGLF